jgi:hypothetical protein
VGKIWGSLSLFKDIRATNMVMDSEEQMLEQMFTLLRLRGLKRDYEAGYKNAIFQAKTLCKKAGIDEPDWLKNAVPISGRGRRGTEEDLDCWRLKLAAMKVCRYAGYTGESQLKKAQELIKKACGVEYTIATLEVASKRAPKNIKPRMIDFQFFEEELGLIEDGEIIDLSSWAPPKGRPKKE